MWRRKPLHDMSDRHLRRMKQRSQRDMLVAIQNADHRGHHNFIKDILSKHNIDIQTADTLKTRVQVKESSEVLVHRKKSCS